MMKRIIPMNGYAKKTDVILTTIHREIGAQSWRGLYVAGWEELKRYNSPCKVCAYKVIFVTGGVLAAGFVVGSTTFGTLALIQAVQDYHEEGKAPIIGHFSEWTMQALLAAFFSLRGPYEIAQLGYLPIIERFFQKEISNDQLSREQQVALYKEKMRALHNQKQNSLIAPPHLPIVEEKQREDIDLIGLDAELQQIFEEIEKELNQTGWNLLKKGWGELKSNNSQKYITALKTTAVVSGTFLLGQFVIYGAGIYWSADEAAREGREGENPSIGGHCLEWFAEMLGVGNAVFTLFSEVANIGSMKLKVEVFYKHIKQLEEKKENNWKIKSDRLKEVLMEQIDVIPQGYFFSLPTYLQYQ